MATKPQKLIKKRFFWMVVLLLVAGWFLYYVEYYTGDQPGSLPTRQPFQDPSLYCTNAFNSYCPDETRSPDETAVTIARTAFIAAVVVDAGLLTSYLLNRRHRK